MSGGKRPRASNPVRLPLMDHKIDAEVRKTIPDEFDSRKQWSNCPSISLIRDQGSCSSCWAVAATEVMTDRICIHSNGVKQVNISTQDLLTCCTKCDGGCNGGVPTDAWAWYRDHGLVSGRGVYDSHQGCQPYSIPRCNHLSSESKLPKCGKDVPTPACSDQCETGYNVPYKNDKHYAANVYYIKNNVQALQYESSGGNITSAASAHTSAAIAKRSPDGCDT